MKKNIVIFVAGMHGNERKPIDALREHNIPFVLGNPKAYEQNCRFIEYDLNAAFGVTPSNYETQRAAEILNEIDEDKFVVDFHTTGADTPPFVIIVDRDMLRLAARTGLTNVVLMEHNIKEGHALINHRRGISIEAGQHDTPASFETTLRVVKNVLKGEEHPVRLYKVFDKITKPGDYVNFQEHKDGFVPIFVGEPAYDFIGLKAAEI